MSDGIAPDARIGTHEAEVLKGLRAWLDDPDELTDEQAEVVRHVVAHPETHRRDINAVIEERFTFADLAAAFERTGPRTWGYPADSWDTVRRVAELRSKTVLTGREAIVRALDERGRSREEIAEMLSVPPTEVDDLLHRIDRRVDAARRTIELLDR